MEGNHPIKFNFLAAHEKLIHQINTKKNLRIKRIKAQRSALTIKQKLHTNRVFTLIVFSIFSVIPKYGLRHDSKDDFYQESSYEVSKVNPRQGNAYSNKDKDRSSCNLVCKKNFLQMERCWGRMQVCGRYCCVEHRIFSNLASNLMIQ